MLLGFFGSDFTALCKEQLKNLTRLPPSARGCGQLKASAGRPQSAAPVSRELPFPFQINH